MSNTDLSIRLFLQLFAILATCRLVGLLVRRFGQPQVVGEMIAGVVLGPSLFGLLLPDPQQRLFPAETRSVLYAASQLGLVLYMFTIGLEFDLSLVRRRMRTAASVSAAGILVPFALGCGIAVVLLPSGLFFGAATPPWLGMLFLGAAMSITAFPMLARIIHEQGLAGTSLGTLALAAGSMDDAIAWCILAVVLACFKADPLIALLAVGGGGIYAFLTIGLGRRLLRPLADHVERQGAVSGPVLSAVLMLVMLAAFTTDALGIYAIFGAFILGTAFPRGTLTEDLRRKIEPFAATMLLPLFFVNSGLNTRMGLIDQAGLWAVLVLVLIAAFVGKAGACWLAARANGESPRVALAIGSLMNARGLMELIALNIGLEHGLITPILFTILVLMAIVTTLAASPMFQLVFRHEERWHTGAARLEVGAGV